MSFREWDAMERSIRETRTNDVIVAIGLRCINRIAVSNFIPTGDDQSHTPCTPQSKRIQWRAMRRAVYASQPQGYGLPTPVVFAEGAG